MKLYTACQVAQIAMSLSEFDSHNCCTKCFNNYDLEDIMYFYYYVFTHELQSA